MELREQQERAEERRLEAEEAGAEVKERLQSLLHSLDRRGVGSFFCLSYNFLGAPHPFGTCLGGGQRGATMSHRQTDRGWGGQWTARIDVALN